MVQGTRRDRSTGGRDLRPRSLREVVRTRRLRPWRFVSSSANAPRRTGGPPSHAGGYGGDPAETAPRRAGRGASTGRPLGSVRGLGGAGARGPRRRTRRGRRSGREETDRPTYSRQGDPDRPSRRVRRKEAEAVSVRRRRRPGVGWAGRSSGARRHFQKGRRSRRVYV